jgi:hypothetical protein
LEGLWKILGDPNQEMLFLIKFRLLYRIIYFDSNYYFMGMAFGDFLVG